MPVDTSIIAGLHQYKAPTALDVMSLQDLATRSKINQQTLEEKTRSNQQQNALLQLLQSPQAVDPQSGRLTPQALAGITQISPEKGIALEHQQRALTLQDMQFNDKKMQIGRNWEEAYVSSYDRALQQTGGNKEKAIQIATQDRLATIDEQQKNGMLSSAGFTQQEIDRARQQQRDPDQVRAMVTAMGGKVEQPPKLEHTPAVNPATPGKLGFFDARTGSFLKDKEGKFIEAPPTPTMIRAEMDTRGDYSKTGEEFINTLPQQYRNLVKKVANYEVDPKTFSAQQGQRERMLSWASQYDPNFDQKEYNSRFQAVNKFNTGPQGNTVRSLNVAIQHMDTARKLGDALKNNDVQGFNKIAQSFAEQTGKSAPTSFDAVKDILADEVVKGVLGAAGSVEDRRSMASKIKLASSPAQLSGVLDSWTELLSGQVEGLRTQYEASTGRKNFDAMLNPRTREAIDAVKSKKGGASDWVERAMKANPGMSREEIEAEGKKRGKL